MFSVMIVVNLMFSVMIVVNLMFSVMIVVNLMFSVMIVVNLMFSVMIVVNLMFSVMIVVNLMFSVMIVVNPAMTKSIISRHPDIWKYEAIVEVYWNTNEMNFPSNLPLNIDLYYPKVCGGFFNFSNFFFICCVSPITIIMYAQCMKIEKPDNLKVFGSK